MYALSISKTTAVKKGIDLYSISLSPQHNEIKNPL